MLISHFNSIHYVWCETPYMYEYQGYVLWPPSQDEICCWYSIPHPNSPPWITETHLWWDWWWGYHLQTWSWQSGRFSSSTRSNNCTVLLLFGFAPLIHCLVTCPAPLINCLVPPVLCTVPLTCCPMHCPAQLILFCDTCLALTQCPV